MTEDLAVRRYVEGRAAIDVAAEAIADAWPEQCCLRFIWMMVEQPNGIQPVMLIHQRVWVH